MVRLAGWSGCGFSPTVLPSRRRVIIGQQKRVAFESKLTLLVAFWKFVACGEVPEGVILNPAT